MSAWSCKYQKQHSHQFKEQQLYDTEMFANKEYVIEGDWRGEKNDHQPCFFDATHDSRGLSCSEESGHAPAYLDLIKTSN